MSHTDLSGVQTLLDERDITRVLHRYATALDERNWELLATCFTPDVSAHYEVSGPVEGYAALESVCRRALTHLSRTQHLIGNVQVDVHTDLAESTCYLQAQHVRQGAPGGDTHIIAGRYVDTHVRTPSGWRIRRRELEQWWTSGNPAVHHHATDV